MVTNLLLLYRTQIVSYVKMWNNNAKANSDMSALPIDGWLIDRLYDAADNTIEGLRGGISTEAFERFLMKLMNDWRIIDVYQQRAAEAIEFQYTYWPDPDNRTARGQEFINVCIHTYIHTYKT